MASSHALILAAGRGTRLLPVTNFIPKPLFSVAGTPAIEKVIKILSIPAVTKIALNIHHLKGKMMQWLSASYPRSGIIRPLQEDILLGTGGAVKNAFDYLGYDLPILVYNADIVCNLDPAILLKEYFHLGCPPALLCLHDRPEFNKIHTDGNNVVSFHHRSPETETLAYTGISVISPELFREIPLKPCSMVTVWEKAITQGQDIKYIRADKSCTRASEWVWEDIGTPCGYLQGNWQTMGRKHTIISPKTSLGRDIKIKGRVIIGREALIGDNSCIEDSIIWPYARVRANETIKNSVVTPHGRLTCPSG